VAAKLGSRDRIAVVCMGDKGRHLISVNLDAQVTD
jgi:hypothetical protein